MRILTLSYEFPPVGGGGARVVDGLVRELANQGHEIDVVTMGFRGLTDSDVVDGVNILRQAARRKRTDICYTREMIPYLLSALPRVKRLVAERQYDINHTHFIFPDGVLAWLLYRISGLPYVITAHGSDVPGYNPDRFQFQHAMLTPLWRRVVKNAECVISPSTYLRELLEQRGAGTELQVIPNGLNADKFDPGREKRMRILVVTRMFERKGVQFLLQALRGRTLDCEINIVGDGPFLNTLKRMAADTPADIRFHGWLDNESGKLKELYETSQIFVFTSRRENCPVNLLEAMTAGMAIVTSQDPGSRELVGDTALCVADNQPDQLYATLKQLTRDPARCDELGRRARQRFEAHYAWPIIADRYLALLEQTRV